MNEKKMKNSHKAAIAVLCLVVVAVALLVVWRVAMPRGQAGAKEITVQVVHGDGTAKTFPLETEEGYLGAALVESGVVENDQDQYGLYIKTADGETVDGAGQEWWKVTQDGEMVNTGADATPIEDGDHFELTFMVGYD